MADPASIQAWLLPAILALFVLGPGFWVLYRLVVKRDPLNLRAEATIDRITAHFSNGSPLKTQHVAVNYSFDAGGRRYEGETVLPLRRFVQSIIPPGPVIIFDVRVNMPVLIADETRIVGDEAIEHQLLEDGNRLRIYYPPGDPAASRVADADTEIAPRLGSPADQG